MIINRLVSLTIILLVAVSFRAHAEIDQRSSADSDSEHDVYALSQSFTAGQDGELIGIWLYGRSIETIDSTVTWTVDVYDYSESIIGNKRSTGSILENQVPTISNWFYIELETPIIQLSNEKFIFIVSSDDPEGEVSGYMQFGIFNKGFDSYDGGRAQPLSENNSPDDWLFQTVINSYSAPHPFYDPAFITVSGKNRLERSIRIPIVATNLDTGETISMTGERSYTFSGETNQHWQIDAPLDVSRYSTFTHTLADSGYTKTFPITAMVPQSGELKVTLYVTNTTPRTIPSHTLKAHKSGEDLKLWGSTVYGYQAETIYRIEYSYDLKKWYTLAEEYTETGRSDPVKWIRVEPEYPQTLRDTQFYRLTIISP